VNTTAYHTESRSVICHPAEVTFPPLPQSKLVHDLATRKGYKAELTCVVVTFQDSLLAKDGHLPQKITGSVMIGIRAHDRESQVRLLTTIPQSQSIRSY